MTKNKDKAKEYPALALIGAGAAKSLYDVPKGGIEKFIEGGIHSKMEGGKFRQAANLKTFQKALLDRGVGRGLGALAVGAPTFPLFVSGMKDLKSGDPDRKKTGIAKVMASGAIYQTGKGAIEYGWEAGRSGSRGQGLYKAMTGGGLGRGAVGVVTSAALASGLASSMRKSEKSGKKRSSIPTALALGGIIGAARQIPESVIAHAPRKLSLKAYLSVLKQPKLYVPRTVGKAVVGAAGAGILGALLDKVMKKREVQ